MQKYYYLTHNGETRSFFDEDEACETVERETADHIQSLLNEIENDDQREQEAETMYAAHDLILRKIMHREFNNDGDKAMMRLVLYGGEWTIERRAPETVDDLPNDDRIVLIQTDYEYEAIRETFPDLEPDGGYCFVVMGKAEYDACFEIDGGGVPWLDSTITEIPRGY